MNVPEDLNGMYNRCLELASKDVEHMSISPEMMLALIERISDLETDSKNLESYVHYECRKKITKMVGMADSLVIDLARAKQELVNSSIIKGVENGN